MFLIVGLGNPGIKYVHTRHNVGFWVIDELASRSRTRLREIRWNSYFASTFLAGEEVMLIKPLTYMNRSGLAVRAFLDNCSLGVEDLLVIYDDMDLPLGRIRIRPRGGSGGHKGMASIIGLLRSEDFCRLRLGVGRDCAAAAGEVDFLLSPFNASEEQQMQEAVFRAADAVEVFLSRGLEAAMNKYNAPLNAEP